jgi:hypothetical protein
MNLLKMRFEDSLEYELKVVNPSEAKVSATLAAAFIGEHSKT